MGYCQKLCCDQGARQLGAGARGTELGEQAEAHRGAGLGREGSGPERHGRVRRGLAGCGRAGSGARESCVLARGRWAVGRYARGTARARGAAQARAGGAGHAGRSGHGRLGAACARWLGQIGALCT